MAQLQDWQGKKVTVVGFGIEGEDLARFFAGRGASVTISDRKPAAALVTRVVSLDEFSIAFSLGSNDPASVQGADFVCVSQGVPLDNPVVVAARDAGTPIASMASLFLENYPGPVLGITGSSGKTTTTSLVDAIFTAANREHLLGGNIGLGLMALLDRVNAPAAIHGEGFNPRSGSAAPWAVTETSHTQLVLTERSPHVAALLRITPNHLDQFTWDEYVALKRKIFAFQTPDDIAVFNADDPVSRGYVAEAAGRTLEFSVERDPGSDGAFLQDETIFWRNAGRTEAVLHVSEIPLRGFHNVANVTGATAIAAACDIGPEAVAAAVREFKAPEHRLEYVTKVHGADYYNDSIATAPERTLAALNSFEEPIVLLLGGRDKNLPLDELMAEAVRRCRAIVTFGESGPMLATAAESAGITVVRTTSLSSAVEAAASLTHPGDVVLLSPACTSFDAYDNFELRGAEFRRLVRELAKEAGE